jgi:DNA-binding transcriptional MerR regulator
MIPSVPPLATVGEIAKLLRVPLHRIEYVLRSRPHIKPRATAGGARCFDDDAIAQIRHELHAIDARRARGGA